ncbi:hypothetical protein Peur_073837 [Populus x canadensis]
MGLILFQMRDKLAIQEWRSIISVEGFFLLSWESLLPPPSNPNHELAPEPNPRSQFDSIFFLFEHPKFSKKPGLSLPSETA